MLSRFAMMSVCATVALCGQSRASIVWNWSFNSTEAGLFITDGKLAGDMAPPGVYTFSDFTVAQSDFSPLGSMSGGTYFQPQPDSGFFWDGTSATAFFRNTQVIAQVTGADLVLSSGEQKYMFNSSGPATQTGSIIYITTEPPDITAALTLAPTVPEPAAVACVSSIAYALCKLRRTRSRRCSSISGHK